MDKPHISTHILDTSRGVPAADVPIKLSKFVNDSWVLVSESKTNANGRCEDFLEIAHQELTTGRFKLTFDVGKYFTLINTSSLYPIIEVTVEITNAKQNYHLPLLLNPFGFSTYRGS